jgi:hypothetical protein
MAVVQAKATGAGGIPWIYAIIYAVIALTILFVVLGIAYSTCSVYVKAFSDSRTSLLAQHPTTAQLDRDVATAADNAVAAISSSCKETQSRATSDSQSLY